MTRYPTLERLPNLVVPTLVVAGTRDPLVRQDRLPVLSALPHVQVVRMAGAHALNFSRGEPMADLIETFMADRSLQAAADRHDGVEVVATDQSWTRYRDRVPNLTGLARNGQRIRSSCSPVRSWRAAMNVRASPSYRPTRRSTSSSATTSIGVYPGWWCAFTGSLRRAL